MHLILHIPLHRRINCCEGGICMVIKIKQLLLRLGVVLAFVILFLGIGMLLRKEEAPSGEILLATDADREAWLSLRGWQVRSIGPGFNQLSELFTIPSQTGDIRLEANLEYRFRMFWKLEGAVFAEAGNIWNMPSQHSVEEDDYIFHLKDFYKSLAADWGLGLRVNLDFILLRLDAGFKVYDPSRDPHFRWVGSDQWLQRDGFAIHFGVGYPF